MTRTASMVTTAMAALLSLRAVLGQTAGPRAPRIWMCRKDAWVLGAQPEAWEFVGKHCDVIKLYIDQIRRADEADLRRFAQVVEARGIEIAVECAGLCNWRAKHGDHAGEMSFQDEFRKVKRYLDAGGRVKYLDMDGPFRRMFYQRTKAGMTRSDYHTLDTAAQELVDAMRLWREAVPELEFYLLTNFPNWGYGEHPAYHSWRFAGEGKMGWGDYKRVLATAIDRTNEAEIPLRGVTVDSPYDYTIGAFRSNQPAVTRGVDWIGRIRELEDDVEARGLEFNLIVNSSRAGSPKTGSDELFAQETLAFVDLYRDRGGTPCAYIIQSWYDYPTAYVPETQPGTMAHLMKQAVVKLRPDAGDAR